MKTCNGGYCEYKCQEGSRTLCKYEGYCDYQCPKDSRPLTLPYTPDYSRCCCAGQMGNDGNCLVCGLKKELK